MMRLADFIDQARDKIVEESIAYAEQLPVLSGQALEILRDHLPLVLEAIARDLEQPQTRAESIAKSQGRGPVLEAETAAQTHGQLRARSGLTIEQLVAEYRVLRSCVLRLWADAHAPDQNTVQDTLRFNEAIDQAVAESVDFFSAELQRWRNIFLGVLGHDLRSPLNGMLLAAEVLNHSADPENVSSAARALLRNGHHMAALLDSLLEYSRSEFGMGMSLHRTRVDLAQLCAEELDVLRATLPGTRIVFNAAHEIEGEFDAARVREALANLVRNAAQHGTEGALVEVSLVRTADTVHVTVANDADPIPTEELQNLFEPLRRYGSGSSDSGRNLGLGLFIVREIARAHGGDATVTVVGRRVAFDLRLPKPDPTRAE